jgi:hypothetical protein
VPQIDHFARARLGRLLRPAALCRFQRASVALLQQRAPAAALLALELVDESRSSRSCSSGKVGFPYGVRALVCSSLSARSM